MIRRIQTSKQVAVCIFLTTLITLSSLLSPAVRASDYIIDTKDTHAFILFRISHLGYSWLIGQFTSFEGSFSYDEVATENSQLEIRIDTASIESFHAERDKHLRGDQFLDTNQYPTATFISQSYQENDDGTGMLKGQLTLKGVTRTVQIETKKVGEGPDPWGGYRLGFEGETELKLKDYNIDALLGAAAETVHLQLYIEGVREKSDNHRIKR